MAAPSAPADNNADEAGNVECAVRVVEVRLTADVDLDDLVGSVAEAVVVAIGDEDDWLSSGTASSLTLSQLSSSTSLPSAKAGAATSTAAATAAADVLVKESADRTGDDVGRNADGVDGVGGATEIGFAECG